MRWQNSTLIACRRPDSIQAIHADSLNPVIYGNSLASELKTGLGTHITGIRSLCVLQGTMRFLGHGWELEERGEGSHGRKRERGRKRRVERALDPLTGKREYEEWSSESSVRKPVVGGLSGVCDHSVQRQQDCQMLASISLSLAPAPTRAPLCVCVCTCHDMFGAFKTTGNASVGSLNLQALQAAHLLCEF